MESVLKALADLMCNYSRAYKNFGVIGISDGYIQVGIEMFGAIIAFKKCYDAVKVTAVDDSQVEVSVEINGIRFLSLIGARIEEVEL